MATDTLKEFIGGVREESVANGFRDERDAETLPADTPMLMDLAYATVQMGTLADAQRKTGRYDWEALERGLGALSGIASLMQGQGAAEPVFPMPPTAAAAHTVRQLLHLLIETGEVLTDYVASGYTMLPLEELADIAIVWADIVADDPDAIAQAITAKRAKNRSRGKGYGRHDLAPTPQEDTVTDSDNLPSMTPVEGEEPIRKVFNSTAKKDWKSQPLTRPGGIPAPEAALAPPPAAPAEKDEN